MPRVLITVVALAVALVAVTAVADDTPEDVDPAARHPAFTGVCAYAEALNLGGTVYLADPGAHQPRFLRDAVAGPAHATVAAREPDADACQGELADGASTYLEPGATLHPVDDWSPAFRLVSVQPSGRMVLYQAAWSTTARLAGDYLDLRGRGVAITTWLDVDCPEGVICDIGLPPPLPRDSADALVESILAGRIDPSAIDHSYGDDDQRFQIDVELPDLTRLDLSFGCDDRTSGTGIVLPDDALTPDEFDRLCRADDPLSR